MLLGWLTRHEACLYIYRVRGQKLKLRHTKKQPKTSCIVSDFIFSRQRVSEPLFLFVSGPSSCCLCSLQRKGWEWWHTSCPRLCGSGQRSARDCGCSTVLLGANMLAHSSASVVGAVPQQAPVLEGFAELFLIRDYPLTSLYNSEAGIG